MSLIAGNLGAIQRVLDAEQIVWGVCAGAAAHLYGNRRPLQDVDILIPAGQIPAIVKMLQAQQKGIQFDGQRILWRGIKLFDDLTIRRDASVFPYKFDAPMQQHMRRMPLLGTQVAVLAPEDVALHKALLNRGAEQGKHDVADVEGIVRRQQLDLDYMRVRGEAMGATAILPATLAQFGITL